MKRRWPFLVAAAVVLCGLLIVATRATEGPIPLRIPPPPVPTPGADPWTDPDALQAQFAWACEAVALVCGRDFGPAPEVRSCTTEQYARAYEAAVQGTSPLRALEDEAPPPAGRVALLKERFASAITNWNLVLLHPAGLRTQISRAREGCSRPTVDLLRFLLVHEATHILDANWWPHFNVRYNVAEHLRWDLKVMVEGHAEYVVSEVALALGTSEEYAEYVAVSRRVPCGMETDKHVVARHDMREYGIGLRLLQRAKRLGGTALVEHVVANPPPYLGGPEWEAEFLRTRLHEIR